MRAVLLAAVFSVASCGVAAMANAQSPPAITKYGERNPAAPKELDVFAFLIGKWEGSVTVTPPDGKPIEIGVTWIGRYILDGMAIADEIHSIGPDGPVMGVTLRQFDTSKKSWIVEFMNVSNSFLRRQVNPESGSVTVDGNTVVVVSEAPDTWSRESYRLDAPDRFTYSIDLSNDGGRTWTKQAFEPTLSRKE